MSMQAQPPVKSALRVFDILELLARETEGVTTHEIGKRLRIAGSSIHALIHTMEARGYVKFTPSRKVVLGSKFYEFAQAFAFDPLLVHSKPVMKQLAEQFNENVHLAVLDNDKATFIAVLETTHPIRYHVAVGYKQEAHLTGVGKMLLSSYTQEQIRQKYAEYAFQPMTPQSIASLDQLLEELAAIRSRGYSKDFGESYEGARCYAAPVYDRHGVMTASISVSVPFFRMEDHQEDQLIQAVLEAGRSISRSLQAPAGRDGRLPV